MSTYYNLLIKEQADAIERIRKNREEMNGPLEYNSKEREMLLQSKKVAEEIEILENAKLREIDFALERINAGVFGICLKCDGQIKEERLNALPYANTCIECSHKEKYKLEHKR